MNMYLMIGAILSAVKLVISLTTEVKELDNAVNGIYCHCSSKQSAKLRLAMIGMIAACIDFFLWPIVVVCSVAYVLFHRFKRSIK